MKNFTYVYILSSSTNPQRHYVGCTRSLGARLALHNTGKVRHTAKLRPWMIEVAIAFREKHKAILFEKYLKSHSGRTFASKRF